MKSRVFLSHTHADKPFVRMVAADIEASGLDLWLDELEILPGDSILRKVSEGIQGSRFLVAFLSTESVASRWVQEELEMAMTLQLGSGQVVVIPLRLPGLQMPGLPLFLQGKLSLDFTSAAQYDASFRQLFRRIGPDAAHERVLAIDAERKTRLVEYGRSPELRNWTIDYLAHAVKSRPDPTERHWAYLSLGEIPDPRALELLEAGQHDPDPFARLGATRAFTRLHQARDDTQAA
jgi:hypothetical protein